MLIRVLMPRTFKAHCFAYPIRVFSEQIEAEGITVSFHTKVDDSLMDCDVLGLVGTAFGKSKLNRNPPSGYEFVKRNRHKLKTIIWFDPSDSTGTTAFWILPYVDLYAKNQLLKNRELYTKQFYGMRIYSDYYHKHSGIMDHQETFREPAKAEDLDKLAVSWNLGLGDWFGKFRALGQIGRVIEIFFSEPKYRVVPTPYKKSHKQIDVSFRGSINYKRASVAYQRIKTREKLAELASNSPYKIIYDGKIPYEQYRAEMRRTRIVISPFGLGEINAGRDFECFVDGAMLFKPDMSHMETWPDYFEPGVTYVPHAWDFSNFLDKLRCLLDNPYDCQEIADAGQKRYLASITEGGGETFARHFSKLIHTAIENSENRV